MSDQLSGSITSEHTHHTAADQAHRFHPLADVFPLIEGDEFQPEYDAQDDFAQSLRECYRAIRERVAADGRPWAPK